MNSYRRTDDDMLAIDVPGLVRSGLGNLGGPQGSAFRGDAAVAASIAADQIDTSPQSLMFLAEVVRRGGRDAAAELAEPLPTPNQAALALTWLTAAADLARSRELDNALALWLETVGRIVALRRSVRR